MLWSKEISEEYPCYPYCYEWSGWWCIQSTHAIITWPFPEETEWAATNSKLQFNVLCSTLLLQWNSNIAKACLCDHGDQLLEGHDKFQTWAPVVFAQIKKEDYELAEIRKTLLRCQSQKVRFPLVCLWKSTHRWSRLFWDQFSNSAIVNH